MTTMPAWAQQSVSSLSLIQQERIVNTPSGLSPLYLGSPSYPQPNLLRIDNGHLQIVGSTGAWGTQTNLLTVFANDRYANQGNQGLFWDPAYRIASTGQDSGAIEAWNAGRPPIAFHTPVARFGRATIQTQRGPRPVYTVGLAEKLDSRQVAEILARPNMRVETSNGFFGYLIPSGYKDPAGSAVPPISADGATLTLDNWVRASSNPVVPASALALPDAYDKAPYQVTIDAFHQINDFSTVLKLYADDMIQVAMGNEFTIVNNKTGPVLALNLIDPLATPLLTIGMNASSLSDDGRGNGVSVADQVCSDGFQACFVARNQTTRTSGTTYGYLVPVHGPDVAIASTQPIGKYVLQADPGDSCNTVGRTCRRTIVLDTAGNMALSGSVGVSGTVKAGATTLAEAAACVPAILGAHFVITDGRKPHEAAGNGSGVPADCMPPAKGAAPTWLSVYDQLPVVN